MSEMRIQINVRVDSKLNMSATFTHLLDVSEETAEDFGRYDRTLWTSYMRGFTAAGLEDAAA